jgi:tetrapyrrole methylase family protein/MazG family protein
MEKKESIGRRFERLVEILSVLRSEHGCPWDREQDERTIVNYFLEEVFEATDAAMADDSRCLEEELGDVLMEVVFLAQIYQEKGRFTIATVLDGIIQKMVRRHPHVFARRRRVTSREVVASWQDHKNSEKKRRSVFEGMSRSAPALLQAFQVGQRAASLGFDWNEARDVLDKVKEEVGELESAIQAGEDKSIGEEIGDLMFSLACLSRLAGHNPELALRAATRKFQRRFRAMEKVLKSRGRKFSGMELEEMDQVWEMVKKNPL